MGLTSEDREALRGLGQGQVPAVVEQIVARHVAEARAAALAEAADAIAQDKGHDVVRNATLDTAARIVRTLADP